jgi:hypothetical protein
MLMNGTTFAGAAPATRRIDHYSAIEFWQPKPPISAPGAGNHEILLMVGQLVRRHCKPTFLRDMIEGVICKVHQGCHSMANPCPALARMLF